MHRQSHRGVLLGCSVMQMCCCSSGAYLYMDLVLRKLQSSFVDITFLWWCSPVGLLHVWGASSLESTFEGLLLNGDNFIYNF